MESAAPQLLPHDSGHLVLPQRGERSRPVWGDSHSPVMVLRHLELSCPGRAVQGVLWGSGALRIYLMLYLTVSVLVMRVS